MSRPTTLAERNPLVVAGERGKRRVTRYPDLRGATHHRVRLAGRIDDYKMAFLSQLVEHTVAKFLPHFSVTKGLNINFVDL